MRGKGKDYTGMKIGKWLVLREDGHYVSPRGVKRRKWLCRCDCGTESSIILSCSAYGRRKTTQCVRCANKSFQKYDGFGGIPGVFWYSLVKNAESRGRRVDITPEYAWEIFQRQDGKCALSGIDLTLPSKQTEKVISNASLDRIDNSIGYVEGNVQWVDKNVNLMRRTLGVREFVELCRLVASHNPGGK